MAYPGGNGQLRKAGAPITEDFHKIKDYPGRRHRCVRHRSISYGRGEETQRVASAVGGKKPGTAGQGAKGSNPGDGIRKGSKRADRQLEAARRAENKARRKSEKPCSDANTAQPGDS